MALKAGRVGVHPSEVTSTGRLKNGYVKDITKLDLSILEEDSGTLTNQYVHVGLAYRDLISANIPYKAMFLDTEELTAVPCLVVYCKPDTVMNPTGRIIYRCYRNGSSGISTLILDTTEDEDNGYVTAWQWAD